MIAPSHLTRALSTFPPARNCIGVCLNQFAIIYRRFMYRLCLRWFSTRSGYLHVLKSSFSVFSYYTTEAVLRGGY